MKPTAMVINGERDLLNYVLLNHVLIKHDLLNVSEICCGHRHGCARRARNALNATPILEERGRVIPKEGSFLSRKPSPGS
jgi:hypothetical protein